METQCEKCIKLRKKINGKIRELEGEIEKAEKNNWNVIAGNRRKTVDILKWVLSDED